MMDAIKLNHDQSIKKSDGLQGLNGYLLRHLTGMLAPPIIAQAQAARYRNAVSPKELYCGESLGVISKVIGCK
jgi:hypothetical protein